MTTCNKCGHKITIECRIALNRLLANCKGIDPTPGHLIKIHYLQCKICKTIWCCQECAIEDDALSHEDFDKMDDEDRPEIVTIECCRCTGKKRSWEERDE